MGLLSEDDISTELASLPDWTRAGASITREVRLADFRAALLYVGAVGYLAEQANHHPDVLIQWNRVTLTLFDALGRRPHRRRLRAGPADQRPALISRAARRPGR